VFETVRVLDGRPVGLAEHAARLAGSLDILGAAPATNDTRTGVSDPGYNQANPGAVPAGLAERCAAVIAANALADGSLKIAVFREAGGWAEEILARPSAYAPARHAAGFGLKTVPCDRREGLFLGLKTLHRPHHQAARAAALAAGFDEALWVDPRGLVLEGSVTNVYVVRDGLAGTPALSAGILPGVMRARVVQLLGPRALREGDIGIGELRQADEVFVTNALLGIMPVARVDGTTFDLAANPVTRALMAAVAESLRSLRA
jgi:branched-subunit amino acid aminotransferase/4-amino-4-deoxychorismate lyase